MSDIAIRAEHISKRYRLGERAPYKSLREVVARAVTNPLNRLTGKNKAANKKEFLWALDDVSFEIRQGEAVGIIGRNGAGKSTLLKILSRITKPTKGKAEIYGRVGSLLEVGTGFHPELTGRENIFLNGAILGMKRNEIARKFDEIVAFAEIEKFLDTPVKRYSSGMYVRLAFAVAAHLEPEILLVDEVLAVGDAAFQKKCLGKMGEVAEEGRTVLFVSHNMTAIQRLCHRTIHLGNGLIVLDSISDRVIKEYLNSLPLANEKDELEKIISTLPKDSTFQLEDIHLFQDKKPILGPILNGLPFEVEIQYQVLQRTTGLRVYIDLCDSEDLLLFRTFHDEQADGIPTMNRGRYISHATFPSDILAPTRYIICINAGIYNIRDCIPTPGVRIPISVEWTGNYNRAYMGDTIRGKLAYVIPWTTLEIKNVTT